MNIRSITIFLDPGWPLDLSTLKSASDFKQRAMQVYQDAGYTIQTTRLALPPFVNLLKDPQGRSAPELAKQIELLGRELGFDYISIGPAPIDNRSAFRLIPEILSTTQSVFVSQIIADGNRVSLVAIRQSAWVIHQCSTITPDGFANLRFGALANVPPGGPFFPGAYHAGGSPRFALAMEAADLAVDAFSNADRISDAADSLIAVVNKIAGNLEEIAARLAADSGFAFGGIDFSLAPFPEEMRSLGAAVERLGVPATGLHGSLAASALITSTLDRARFTRAGYCGMMMPVLEDAVLARRAAEGSLGVSDLLMYSAVCGVGLDTVPIPGDTSEGQLAAVLLDMAALSCRLSKPLAARLMPVPGKKAGDPTGFDFEYFANSRVMAVHAEPLVGLLASGDWLEIEPLGERATKAVRSDG